MELYGQITPAIAFSGQVGAGSTTQDLDAVHYSAESKTDNQKQTARDNIGAVSSSDVATIVSTKANKTELDSAKKRIHNLEEMLKGKAYTVETDDDSAYVKDVPAGAMPNAELSLLFGKTIVWNQLVNKNSFEATKTVNGITFTNNGDGSVTANGTATANADYYFSTSFIGSTIVNHKYIVYGCPAGGQTSGTTNFFLQWDSNNDPATDYGNGALKTRNSSETVVYVRCRIISGRTVNNIKFIPQIRDLTKMFGAGNEPATVAEFKAMIQNSYYSYDTGSLKSASVDKIVSVGNNILNVEESESGGLDSSGREVSGATLWRSTNYIEVEPNSSYIFSNVNSIPTKRLYEYDANRNFISPRKEAVGLNNLQITTTANTRFLRWSLYDSSAITESKVKSLGLQIEKGSTATAYNPYTKIETQIPSAIQSLPLYGCSAGTVYNYIDWQEKNYHQRVGSRAYQIGDENNASYITDETTTYYPLATEIVTDISNIPFDNFLQVEAGGSLAFHNSNGDIYGIACPSTVNYMIELANAI